MVTMDPLQVAEEVVESSPNKLEDIYRLLSEGSFPSSFCSIKKKNLKRYARKFTLEGGCLYYVGSKNEEKREVVVDPERRHQIFIESHLTESGHHLGQKKTANRIQSRYYWLGIVKDVIDWIKMCETCQNAEHHKNTPRKCKPVKVDHPWEVLSIAFHGPFPPSSQQNTYVLTVTDFYTKWIEAVALPNNDAAQASKVLANLYYRYGAARNIYCNQGWDFCKEVSRNLYERCNISQTLTQAEASDHTGLDEMTYEGLKSSIRMAVSDNPSEWDELLESILFTFRTSINPVTKYTPYFLMFSREIQLSLQTEATEVPNSQGTSNSNNESLVQYTCGVQEQRAAVLANLLATEKQERKSTPRPNRCSPPSFQGHDGIFVSGAVQPVKKFKHTTVMSFKLKNVLFPEGTVAVEEMTS
ncbi:gypsy retrotransposon integrase-like protein 1 isoform X1 [Xenopus laevis]|uniref:Gypsy retrotransposon integrase-like protein 1 n=1 Tax=Xenopus laevis TaxID=8355 RepID=A0A8J1M3V0_XENLA|nr:gypsy retrotransposon integrase-like protein 1 isoform X1 [Xenopus laevis]